MNREVEFTAELWNSLKQYLEKYTVNGHKLVAKPPSSVVLKGKVPDIVVVDSRGLPQLIIETKRKAEGRPLEELLNPLGPAPIAHAMCYAALAIEEYNLSRSPLFATANRGALILFKGINRDDLDKIVSTRVCLEPKRAPEDWIKALIPGGLKVLLKDYIIDRIEHPLKDESLKKLLEYVGKWLVQTPISLAAFYKVFVSQLRSSIENLHEYVADAVKTRIISDGEHFVKLYNKAKEMGYPLGLLSKGLLELVCPSHSKKICEYLKEVIEEKLSMPIINVKKINRADVSELAKFFDELESKARELAKNEEEIEEEEEKVTKLKMFEELKPYFQAIDRKIAEVLGISIDVEWLWNSAWEMMERRIKGTRGPTRPGAEVSLEIDVGGKRKVEGADLRHRMLQLPLINGLSPEVGSYGYASSEGSY